MSRPKCVAETLKGQRSWVRLHPEQGPDANVSNSNPDASVHHQQMKLLKLVPAWEHLQFKNEEEDLQDHA